MADVSLVRQQLRRTHANDAASGAIAAVYLRLAQAWFHVFAVHLHGPGAGLV
ncbi:hypothetical protein D3C87_2119110 [compost metagenome]